jgi:hypothetical protein
MVKREPNNSFTVTFVDASSPVAASGDTTKTTSAMSPASGTLESWHATIEKVEAGITNVLTYIDNNPTKAREEASKLSAMITTAYKGLSSALQITLKDDKKQISKKMADIFKRLGTRGMPTSGGGRTHRKRTHRKRTPQKHRKRTHRNPRKRSLKVLRR